MGRVSDSRLSSVGLASPVNIQGGTQEMEKKLRQVRSFRTAPKKREMTDIKDELFVVCYGILQRQGRCNLCRERKWNIDK